MRAWRRDLLASSLLFPRVDVNHRTPRPSLLGPSVVPPLFLRSLRPSLNSFSPETNAQEGKCPFWWKHAWAKHAAGGDWTLWILVFLPSIFSRSTYSLLLLQSSHWQWVRGQRAAPSVHNSNTLHDVHLLTSRFSWSIKYSAVNQWNWIKPGLLKIDFCVVFLFEEAWTETLCSRITLHPFHCWFLWSSEKL